MSVLYSRLLFLTVVTILLRLILSDSISTITADTYTATAASTPATIHPATTATTPSNENVSTTTEASDIILKLMSHRCFKKYTVTCFKLDMVRLVDKLGNTPSYQLLPGVKLVHLHSGPSSLRDVPFSLLQSIIQGNDSSELDDFLAARVNNYLNSITLSVKLLDQRTVSRAKKIGEEILEGFAVDVQTGRKKGYGGALWAAGTIAAVGVASLAAVAGKALMTSMLALLLAAGGALRGSGGSGGCDKGAYHYMTAHGRNMELQELTHKPIETTSIAYRIYGREP